MDRAYYQPSRQPFKLAPDPLLERLTISGLDLKLPVRSDKRYGGHGSEAPLPGSGLDQTAIRLVRPRRRPRSTSPGMNEDIEELRDERWLVDPIVAHCSRATRLEP